MLLKIRTPKYINTDRTKGKIKKYTIIIGYFSSPLYATDRTTREKIRKDIKFWTVLMQKI